MQEKCEKLEGCGFFNNFKGNSEASKRGLCLLYCHDKKKSEKCKRKQFKLKTGNPPADNMAPSGKML